MNKKIISILSVLVVVGGIALSSFAHGTVDTAVTYLNTKTPDAWISMALVASGRTADVSYINTNPAAGSSQVTEVAKYILALVAAGANPHTQITGTDLVAELKGFAAGGQIGDINTYNDDIWGVLALSAAGEVSSDSVIQGAKTFIISNQNTDGGWGWAVGQGSDSNDTASAVSALLQVGVPKTDAVIVNAVNYLKTAQNTDGGFTYDPVSQWGTASDANSDAWVISAIYKLGESPADAGWTKGGYTAVDHLNSLQNADGYFGYQSAADAANSFSPDTTAQAVIALSGKSYPVMPGSGNGGGSGSSNNQTGVHVYYKFENGSGPVCQGDTYAEDAMEVVADAAVDCGLTYHITQFSFGPMLDGFGSDTATSIDFWLYAVNFVSPDIGAVDYLLQEGDYVIWHFGPWPWDPASSGTSLELSATVGSSSNSNGSQTHNNSVSFSANIASGGNSLGFGNVSPGSSNQKTVTLHNSGQSGIHFESYVSGDDVFKNYLNINNNSWRNFSTNLDGGASEDEVVKLQIPSGYNNSGTKNGNLIFWGAPIQ